MVENKNIMDYLDDDGSNGSSRNSGDSATSFQHPVVRVEPTAPPEEQDSSHVACDLLSLDPTNTRTSSEPPALISATRDDSRGVFPPHNDNNTNLEEANNLTLPAGVASGVIGL